MKLKKKLVSLLLSVGVIANITSVNMFAVEFDMDYSDFSLVVFKLNQSAEKFLYSSSNKSIDEKLRFLKIEGFEQIETFLVNAFRFPRFMWMDLMRDIRDEICSIKSQVKDNFKITKDYAMLCNIYKMLYIFSSEYICYQDTVRYWKLFSEWYDYFSREATNQKDYERFKKMSSFCKGYALLKVGDKFFEDGKLEKNRKIDRSSESSIKGNVELLKSAYRYFGTRVIYWDSEMRRKYKTNPYFRFYVARDCYNMSGRYFQELDLGWGMEEARVGYNNVLTELPSLKKSPRKSTLRPTEQEQRFMYRKNFASADKMFLLSLDVEAYNSAVEEYLFNPRDEKPELVMLAPFRLEDHAEPSAKKPRLNEQTNSSAPFAPTAPVGGSRPLDSFASIASMAGSRSSAPSAPTAPMGGSKHSAPTAPVGGSRPFAPFAPTAPIGGLRPGSPSDPITLIEESESGTRSDLLPVTEDAETRSNLNCLKWFQDVYDKLKQV